MNFFKKSLTMGLVLLASLILVGCGTNGSQGESKGTLTVGLECNYAPFNWTETVANDTNVPIDGKTNQYADGYDIQISKKICEYLDYDLVIKKLDWDSLIPSLEGGEINAIIAGMTDTPEREMSIDFSNEYYRSELVLIVKKVNYTDVVLTSEDLKVYLNGKSVESQVSTVTDDVIDIFAADYGAIHSKPVDSFPSAASDVSSGIVFAMTAELPVAKSICASNSNLGIVHIDQSILGEKAAELGVSIGIKKGDMVLKEALNSALSSIDQDTRNTLMETAVFQGSQEEQVTNLDKITYLLTHYYQTFLDGLISTLILAIVGTIVGLIIGIFIALGKSMKISKDDNIVKKSGKGLVKALCTIYSVVLRGTPMMVQALIFKFGCQAMGINFGSFLTGVRIFDGWLVAGLIVITLNTGAYMGEDIRTGLNGLDVGQKEAALSLGMSKFEALVKVVLPQALRNTLPTLANEYIINIKDSSVLNVISVTELFLSVSIATSQNYFIIQGYIIIACIYLLLTLVATWIFKEITFKLDGKKHQFNFFRRAASLFTNKNRGKF